MKLTREVTVRIARTSLAVVLAALVGGFLGSLFFGRGGTQAFAAPQSRAVPNATSTSVLVIDVNNITTYLDDGVPNSEKATHNFSTPAIPKPFQNLYGIGDIIAVNGKPARGTWSVFTALNFLAPVELPGIAIADTFRGGVAVTNFEILNADLTPRGTVMAIGLAGGQAPPLSGVFGLHFGNLAVAGGTGEFVGVRGVSGETTNPTDSFRFASTAEDPSIRRQVNGGKLTFVVTLIR